MKKITRNHIDKGNEEDISDELIDELDSLLDFDNDNENFFGDILTKEEKFEEEKYRKINETLEQVNKSKCTPKRRKLLKEIIEEYPGCVDLYLFLIEEYDSFQTKMKLCEEALEIAKKIIGDETDFKKLEKKQAFWGLHKTRPYMEVLFNQGFILYCYDLDDGAALVWKEMIQLCPNDNLGVREYLFEYLLGKKDKKAVMDLLNKFPDDALPATIWTRIIMFLENNEIKEANNEIKIAIEFNKHILKLLFNKKKYKIEFTDRITFGSKDEAEQYCAKFKKFWSKENLEQLKKLT